MQVILPNRRVTLPPLEKKSLLGFIPLVKSASFPLHYVTEDPLIHKSMEKLQVYVPCCIYLVLQVNKFINEDNKQPQSRIPAQFGEEYVKFLHKTTRDRLLEEDSDSLQEYIDLHIREDKRFSKEVNDRVHAEVSKRLHDLQFQLYQTMQRNLESTSFKFGARDPVILSSSNLIVELQKMDVFDPLTNKARMRSIFKAEVEQLKACVYEIQRDVVMELEQELGIPHQTSPVRDTRSRRNSVFLENLRPSTPATSLRRKTLSI